MTFPKSQGSCQVAAQQWECYHSRPGPVSPCDRQLRVPPRRAWMLPWLMPSRQGGTWEPSKPLPKLCLQGMQEALIHRACAQAPRKGGQSSQGPKSPRPQTPTGGHPPTFLELDQQDVRAVGGFNRVLGLCVEAWRRLVLTKARKVRWGTVPVPGSFALHLLQKSVPLSRTRGWLALAACWHCPAGLPAASPSQPSLPGTQETKGSRNQTIFPLNLISSFSSTPPQLEVE